MYYVGAKWGKNSNPNLFMTKTGYKTSSPRIKELIKLEGLDSFRIRKIKIFDCADKVQKYENRFLVKINAANNPKFFNRHNNVFGSYVPDPENDTKKRIRTSLIKYGMPFYSQTEECKEKVRKTNLERYGVEYYTQLESVKSKLKNTVMVRDAEGNVFRISKEDSMWVNGEVSAIQRNRGGYKLSDETKYKMSKNNVGFKGRKHTNESNEKRSKTLKETVAKREPIICPYCGLKGNGGNMKRYHFNNCKHINSV